MLSSELLSRTSRALGCLLLVGLVACDRTIAHEHHEVVYPKAEPFEPPPVFAGSWRGKLAGHRGELQLGELRRGEYYGNFTADDGALDVALLLEQSMALIENGASVPSNRLVFDWQDGTGERGHGWLLVDQAGHKLTGASGFGEAIEGFSWTFRRSETPTAGGVP